MAEYIDRERLKQAIAEDALIALSDWDSSLMDLIMLEVEELSAADVAPVVHGRWIERQAPHAMGGVSAKCSACGKSVQYLGNPLNYCPNCGAKMDGGTE